MRLTWAPCPGSWSPGRWEMHDPADPIRPDGWLVWGGGVFAGAERIDDAIKAWRAAARKAWR